MVSCRGAKCARSIVSSVTDESRDSVVDAAGRLRTNLSDDGLDPNAKARE
jgi:hypothetical protein